MLGAISYVFYLCGLISFSGLSCQLINHSTIFAERLPCAKKGLLCRTGCGGHSKLAIRGMRSFSSLEKGNICSEDRRFTSCVHSKDSQPSQIEVRVTTGFPGNPDEKTPCFHCRGVRLTLGWGTEILYAMWCTQQRERRATRERSPGTNRVCC